MADRHTPLRPAIWMTGVLAWALVIALFLRAPTWGSVFLSTLTGVSFLFYLVSYAYLMRYDRESLYPDETKERAALAEGDDPASPIDVSASEREGSRRDF